MSPPTYPLFFFIISPPQALFFRDRHDRFLNQNTRKFIGGEFEFIGEEFKFITDEFKRVLHRQYLSPLFSAHCLCCIFWGQRLYFSVIMRDNSESIRNFADAKIKLNMEATVSRQPRMSRSAVLKPLLGMSTRTKKWLADRLYESVRDDKEEAELRERAQILADIKEALLDVKMGRTRPAEELLKELRNGDY